MKKPIQSSSFAVILSIFIQAVGTLIESIYILDLIT